MKHPFLLVIASFTLFSCTVNTDEVEDKTSVVDTKITTTNVIEQLAEDNIDLPSPLRISTTFKRSGLKFIEASLNPLDNALHYNTSYSRALNLGIYSADMAYCLLNKQYALSKDYLKTCKDIGGQIGLNSAFEANNLGERFEKNLGKDDSLLKLVSDLQLQTDLVLEKGEQGYISVLIFTGAWLETLHSAEQVYMKGEEKMALILVEQGLLINNLIRVLEQNKNREVKIDELITDLITIRSELNKLEFLKNQEEEDFDLAEIKIEPKLLTEVCSAIESVRNKIIKG